MAKFKEITPQEADACVSLKVPFWWKPNGIGDGWLQWDYGECGTRWTPSHYPSDKFRVEVE